MGSFRTSSVFRFTRDYELLRKILRDGIIPNFCEEDLSFGEQKFYVGIPMASFCDIPIMLLDEHTSRYGNYGLALSKEWAIKQGITPVMYVANDIVLQSVFYHHHQNQRTLEWFHKEVGQPALTQDNQVLRLLSPKEYYSFLNTMEEHSINTHIIGYLKKYIGEYKSKPINNYEENEWRYLVPDEKETKWFWTQDEYRSWRFPNEDYSADKPSPSAALKSHTLRFSYNDVRYILLKDDEFKARMIDFIKKTKTIGGTEITSEENREDLICKLMTLDQVKRDF